MKKLTKGELNLMKEFGIEDVYAPPTVIRTNIFSGEGVNLNTAAARIFDLVMGMQRQYDMGVKINVAKFDRLRYLFLKLWPDSYMSLLD